jgi:hypothetical protein
LTGLTLSLTAGFSLQISQWAATNIKAVPSPSGQQAEWRWSFDLDGIAEMYKWVDEHFLHIQLRDFRTDV